MEEKWVIYRETNEGLDFLCDITSKCKVLPTSYVESAMAFPTKEIALKMVDIVESMSEQWFNSNVAKVKFELNIEK